ncbi:MAG: DNA repair protein RecO [Pseudomonadota bacterium]
MDWRDEGILLSVAEHGESSAIIDVLTSSHGRHPGLVRGGQGAKLAAALQPGTELALEWRARLEDHLGNYRVEPVKSRAAQLMENRAALAAFGAMSALLIAFVPERQPDYELYEASHDLLVDLAERPRDWPGTYLRWEATFLGLMGFGLDLSSCAATGRRRDLAYVSPRTGRAVSREAGGPFAEKLLPLPPFLAGEGVVTMAGVRSGLEMTGWFLDNRLRPAMEREAPLPEARNRLLRQFDRMELPARSVAQPGATLAPQPDRRADVWNRRLGTLRQAS